MRSKRVRLSRQSFSDHFESSVIDTSEDNRVTDPEKHPGLSGKNHSIAVLKQKSKFSTLVKVKYRFL